MVTLLQQIKKDQLRVRKAKQAIPASLLTTLLGEASMIGKNDGNRESTDAEVISVIKKFIKNIDESLKVKPDKVLVLEKLLLEGYLPTQLTGDTLVDVVQKIVLDNQLTSPRDMGAVMKIMKESCAGQYDGKEVSTIVKEILNK